MKPKYPEYGRCHLLILTSFGARVCAVEIRVGAAKNKQNNNNSVLIGQSVDWTKQAVEKAAILKIERFIKKVIILINNENNC